MPGAGRSAGRPQHRRGLRERCRSLILLCDADDRPLRPAILYGIDMRATAEIEELTERYGAPEILARGGTPLTTQAVGPKALWVRRNEPDVWSKAASWYNSN